MAKTPVSRGSFIGPQGPAGATGATGPAGPTVVVVNLSYAGTLAIDASLGTEYRVTVTNTTTISVPTNGTDGQKLLYVITASGGRTVNLAGGYELGGVVTSRAVVIASGDVAYVGVHNRNGTWRILAVDAGS